ncbi:MAG: DUF2164 domain-containing protein [Candidatus Marinimicrobia bacterium]|jgi:uncharacterized protein (DUF2164 family)|nr:DUF2164 domain-containing protein [Candidatus Neomarinimicrobiota bacterium]MBT4360245.1 DUF2164 domain-containing protein [Candidatus Neomarinimicrobiota bacterium]MBT4715387.1 DUF2164 domain-containing protein [Candidatus Neomarinimicrobiota bacterium]MBT4946833.1 DUF2164 domain-containing protein [Candidatus Neomarinimicrobiota bacterium]MBT5270238.1 DUF2164 domain-containing protein [Candidatus Neomarinimicrobiota bacterium]
MINTFSREMKDNLIQQIQTYFTTEMSQELGNFEAEFLLDFFSENIGPHYYNQAIRDTQKHLSGYVDTLNERIDELEKPLPEST